MLDPKKKTKYEYIIHWAIPIVQVSKFIFFLYKTNVNERRHNSNMLEMPSICIANGVLMESCISILLIDSNNVSIHLDINLFMFSHAAHPYRSSVFAINMLVPLNFRTTIFCSKLYIIYLY